jgi:hypothetical protein
MVSNFGYSDVLRGIDVAAPRGVAPLDDFGRASAMSVLATGQVSPTTLAAIALSNEQLNHRHRYSSKYFMMSGSTTTTTGTMTLNSTTLTLAAPIDFINGQGIRVSGAGTVNGTELVTTIVSGAGTTTLILAAPATTAVTGAVVQHDDTTPFQNALNYMAANGGGRLDIGTGIYQLGGPLQNPTGANAVIQLPTVAFGSDVTIELVGTASIGSYGENIPTIPLNGTTFVFPYALTGGSGVQQGISFNQYFNAAAQPFQNYFTFITLHMRQMRFKTPALTGYTWIGLHGVQNAVVKDVCIDNGIDSGASQLPTNNKETGISLPGPNNSTRVYCEGVMSCGFYNGITPAEHAILNGVFLQNCVIAIAPQSAVHLQYWLKILSQNCQYVIGLSANDTGTGGVYCVGTTDSELSTTGTFPFVSYIKSGGIDLFGKLDYKLQATGGGSQPYNSGYNMLGSDALQLHQLDGGGEQVQTVKTIPINGTYGPFKTNGHVIFRQTGGMTGLTITRNTTVTTISTTITSTTLMPIIPVMFGDILTSTGTGTAATFDFWPFG